MRCIVEGEDSNGARIHPDAIAVRLASEFGYSPIGAATTAQNLFRCSHPVRDAFDYWWHTGELGSLEIEGFSAEALVRNHALLPPGAFLMLDWLLREPGAAKAALARGHDSVRRPEGSGE